MLALVSLFLTTLVVAAFVIWVYRIFFGAHNYEGNTVAKKRAGRSFKLSGQKGYISLKRKPAKASHRVKTASKFHSATGVNKVPWGW